ncbi:MAG: hypothetical protein ACOZAJ_00300 [Patescibacteria group bacterium]
MAEKNKNKINLIDLGKAANKVAYAKSNPGSDVVKAMKELLETVANANPEDWEKFKKINEKN